MGQGSKLGAFDLAEAFKSILIDHLVDRVNEIEASKGMALGTVKVPDLTHGITMSRLFHRNTHSAVAIYVSASEPVDENMVRDHPIREHCVVTIRLRYGVTDQGMFFTEEALQYIVAAIKFIIRKHWRFYTSACFAGEPKPLTTEDASSIRDQYNVEGMVTRGRALRDVGDILEVPFACIQWVEHLITLDK